MGHVSRIVVTSSIHTLVAQVTLIVHMETMFSSVGAVEAFQLHFYRGVATHLHSQSNMNAAPESTETVK